MHLIKKYRTIHINFDFYNILLYTKQQQGGFMNKEYTYIDGKVIIKDENGYQTLIEYYDNLDEVLVQENLIETIENNINEKKKKKDEIKLEKASFSPVVTVITLITIFGAPPILCWFNNGIEILKLTVDTIYGPFNFVRLIQFLTAVPSTLCALLFDFQEYKMAKAIVKEKNAITSELEAQEELLVIEKEKLVELQKNKTKNNENNEFRVVEVNDKEKLTSLRNYLSLFYDLGYNSDKYYKYYEQGILEEKLKKHYDEDGIQAAKKYLEEKGPVLSKKRNNNK